MSDFDQFLSIFDFHAFFNYFPDGVYFHFLNPLFVCIFFFIHKLTVSDFYFYFQVYYVLIFHFYHNPAYQLIKPYQLKIGLNILKAMIRFLQLGPDVDKH